MNKIIYINRNLQTKDISILEDGEDFVNFVEDCFVICVIYKNEVIKPYLEQLTALERYAMASNGFDYMTLQDKDFRNANTTFGFTAEDFVKLDASAYLEPAPAPASVSVPAMVPVYRYPQSFEKHLSIVNTPVLDDMTLKIVSPADNLNGYLNEKHKDFNWGDVINCGGLFMVLSKDIPQYGSIFIDPVKNEYCFSNPLQWTQVHWADFSYWSVKKGYVVVWQNTLNSCWFVVSTTPLDDGTLPSFSDK